MALSVEENAIFKLLEDVKREGKYGNQVRSADIDELIEHKNNGKSFLNPPPLLNPTCAKDFYDRIKSMGKPCVMMELMGGRIRGLKMAICKDIDRDIVMDARSQIFVQRGLTPNGKNNAISPKMDKVVLESISKQYNKPMYEFSVAKDKVKAKLIENEFMANLVRFSHQNIDGRHVFNVCGQDKNKADVCRGIVEFRLSGKDGQRFYSREKTKLDQTEKTLKAIEEKDHLCIVDMVNPKEVFEFDRGYTQMAYSHYIIKDNGVEYITRPSFDSLDVENGDSFFTKNTIKLNVQNMFYPVAIDKEVFKEFNNDTQKIFSYCNDNVRVYTALGEEEQHSLDMMSDIKDLYLYRINEINKAEGYDKDFEQHLLNMIDKGEMSLSEYLYYETGDEIVDKINKEKIDSICKYVNNDQKKEFFDLVKNAKDCIEEGIGTQVGEVTREDRLEALYEHEIDIEVKQTLSIDVAKDMEQANKLLESYINDNWEEEIEEVE